PPAVSAVVWGCGLPATVPLAAAPAGVVMLSSPELGGFGTYRVLQNGDCYLANTVHERAGLLGGQLLAGPDFHRRPGRPEQHVRDDDQLKNAARRHRPSRPGCDEGHHTTCMPFARDPVAVQFDVPAARLLGRAHDRAGQWAGTYVANPTAEWDAWARARGIRLLGPDTVPGGRARTRWCRAFIRSCYWQ